MIRMNLELLWKYVDNVLIFVNFPWELGVAMSFLLPGSSQIMFGFGVYKMNTGGLHWNQNPCSSGQ